jgi:lanosterol synthase
MSATHFDVAICGAGPVGCVAALAFAQKGARVLLLEADPRTSDRLAGEWLHPPALAALASLGVELPPAAPYDTGRGFCLHPEDGSDPIVLPYPAGKAGYACDHALLVETLRAHAQARATVELVPWARVRRIDGQVVTFEVERASGQRTEGIHSVRADLIVGATGRTALETGEASRAIGARVFSRTVGLVLSDVRLPFEGYRHLFVGGPGPVTAHRLDARTVRLSLDVPMSLALPRDPAAAAQMLEDAYRSVIPRELRPAFRRALRERPLRALDLRWADNVVHPRTEFGREGFALVGDAVGTHHPLTALGLTLGFEDAMALARASSVAAYAKERLSRARIPEMLALALYEVFADHADSTLAVRQAVYRLFRHHPTERLRTMGFLVGEGGRTRLSASLLFTVLSGSADLARHGVRGGALREAGAAMADLGARLGGLLAGTFQLTDALSAVAERRLAARLFGSSVEDRYGAALRASRGGAAVVGLTEAKLPVAGTIERALERGVRALVAEQADDGSFEGEVVWCPMLAAQYVLAMHAMGRPLGKERRKNVLRHFEDTMLPSGTWGLHELSKPYLFTTILVYVAARLLGLEKSDPLLARAYEFIRAEGGAAAVPSWGKLWLAVVGLYDWQGVSPVVAEAWLLPEWLPVHPSNYYCHTRLIYMAMATVSGARFVGPVTPRVLELRDELFPGGFDKVDFREARTTIRPADLHTPWSGALRFAYDALARFETLRSPEKRAGLLGQLRENIRYELRSTHYTCISPVSGLLNMLALHAADPNDPDLLQALDTFDGWVWEDEEKGARVAGARSATWDTAFAGQALAAVAPHVDVKSALARADEFLASQQIQHGTGREAEFHRIDPSGGFCFAGVWHGWPVSDCTAEAILARMETPWPAATPASLEAAVRFILRTQNSDGGFGSYEARRVDVSLEWLNPAEMFGDSMTEKSYVECTSSCVAALAAFRHRHPAILSSEVEHAIRRGVASLRARQRPDGSWPAMWGVHFVYGTMFGIRGLVAAGVPSHDPAVRRACAWLLARQRPDGGWGEHHSSGDVGRYVEHTESQITQTAWALLALADAEEPDFAALTRAASFLERRQDDDGTWPKQDPEGVFFHTALLDYVLYRRYFPVWALGAYESRRKARALEPHAPHAPAPQPALH